jgi:hypothetical protein
MYKLTQILENVTFLARFPSLFSYKWSWKNCLDIYYRPLVEPIQLPMFTFSFKKKVVLKNELKMSFSGMQVSFFCVMLYSGFYDPILRKCRNESRFLSLNPFGLLATPQKVKDISWSRRKTFTFLFSVLFANVIWSLVPFFHYEMHHLIICKKFPRGK